VRRYSIRFNRDLEIRDLYNNEEAFNLSEHYVGAYRRPAEPNLAFYDGLEEKRLAARRAREPPLTELLLADYLVVDPSRPFCETKLLRD